MHKLTTLALLFAATAAQAAYVAKPGQTELYSGKGTGAPLAKFPTPQACADEVNKRVAASAKVLAMRCETPYGSVAAR